MELGRPSDYGVITRAARERQFVRKLPYSVSRRRSLPIGRGSRQR